MLTAKLHFVAATVAIAGLTGLAYGGSCASYGKTTASKSMDKGKTIVQVASEAGQFQTLLAAAKSAGLAETLSSQGPLTVFAPTDDAFAKLPEGTVESLLKPANRDKLRAILTYHVVAGKVKAADVVKLDSAATVQGQRLAIHASDQGVKVDNANVIKTDIKASNGVIHVIDSVMLPKNIVQVAQSARKFTTLLAAVEAAGLEQTLASNELTVFAPTDDAFAKLPAATIEALLQPENRDQLKSILTYHVAPGRLTAAQVLKMEAIPTAQGQALSVNVEKRYEADGKKQTIVRIDGARVVMTDIPALNGVIHVIDAVVLPDQSSAAEKPATDHRLVMYTR